MKRADLLSLLALPPVFAFAAAVTWAGGQSAASLAGIPVFWLCAGLAFGINILAFLPAYLAGTERYYDLIGSATYLGVATFALLSGGPLDARAWLLWFLVSGWALRLGSFLFARIRRDGRDGRFDEIKMSFARFLLAWTLQGLWVLLTLACALAALSTTRPRPLGALALLGFIVWLAGFALEVVADREKGRFRADPANRGRFIQSGVWAWSRHPNYFGEITLWVGIALIALPVLQGWQHVTLISPLFVALLLLRISGIPLLEARAMERWGDDPDYLAYRDRTPALVPRPPRVKFSGPAG